MPTYDASVGVSPAIKYRIDYYYNSLFYFLKRLIKANIMLLRIRYS